MSDTQESMPAQSGGPPQSTKDGPDYRDTKQLPAVRVDEGTVGAILTEVRAMREESRVQGLELTEKVDALTVVVDTLQHDAKDTRMQIGRLWREVDEVKERHAASSMRAKEPSTHDLKTESALASEINAREALAKKVDILDEKTDDQTKKIDAIAAKPDTAAVVLAEVRDLAKTPTAKKLGAAVLPVLMIAISILGLKLQAQMTKLEEKPQTVQPAPTVYLPIPAVDGGTK